MEQIIKTILDSGRPIEFGLMIILLIGVSAIFLYTKTLKKAAKNDYHEMPIHLKEMLNEIRFLRTDSNNAHNKQIEILGRIDGKLEK